MRRVISGGVILLVLSGLTLSTPSAASTSSAGAQSTSRPSAVPGRSQGTRRSPRIRSPHATHPL